MTPINELWIDKTLLHEGAIAYVYPDGSVEIEQYDEDVWLSASQFQQIVEFAKRCEDPRNQYPPTRLSHDDESQSLSSGLD